MEQLYRLLEWLNRAETLQEVFDSAMEFILSALCCQKVSILLCDSGGIMRFAAWRGLSEQYRKAVEGHSPWGNTEADPQPICVSDVEKQSFGHDLDAQLRREGIRALAFIPLTYQRRLLGKFMLYFETPHQFGADEILLAQAIATQLSVAVQRRQGEESLRQSEERYRMVIRQTKDYAIFSTDPSGRPTMWNEGVQRILGFSEEEFVNQDVFRFIFTPEDITAGIPEKELEVASQTGSANNDRWLRRKDGARFWAEGTTSAVRDSKGNLVGFTKVFRDQTAAWEAKQALQKWEFIFNHAGWAVVATDAQTDKLILVNRALARMHGYGVQELVGRPVEILFAEEALSSLPGHIRAVHERGDYEYDSIHRRKDGSTFPVHTHVTALKDDAGKLLLRAATVQDITERNRNLNELAVLQDRLAEDLSAMTHLHALGGRALQPEVDLLQEVLEVAIAITGADKGNIQMLDEQSRTLKIVAQRGFSSEFVRFFDQAQRENAACLKAFRSRQRIIVHDVTESSIFTGWESLKVLQAESVRAVQSTPLLDRDGKVLGIVSTHFSHPHRPSENDIHFLDLLARQAAESIERDRADRALRQAKEELAKANRELDETVQRRTASLQEALSSLETLLYTIAHDLRTPNRAMQGYAHLLMTSHSSGLGEQELFFLQRIEAGALKNEALIRDLLEFGRLAHAEFPCHAISPVDSIRAVLQGLELEIKGKQAHVDVAPHWPEVVANDSALGHVLINLISNALKFNRPGVSPLVRIFPLDAGEYVRVCVQDNGIGVPKDQWETIFRPFHRASNANWEGTGMGLAIVRKATERMGGRAGLESQLGEGSTFWIELRKTTDELPGASLRRG